ncbi:hypothetical protein DRE_06440 [Drechslerella stenobrocha 248]|uniref:DUF7707 domain-containing protein n=1 Tax=Drechslerella stenobrocha 248 TaxID=1043628 RepID=W7HXF9_9PEZI|nr:hypothetical protein DRE_06440 [Drechslerella stenobrocha 248]
MIASNLFAVAVIGFASLSAAQSTNGVGVGNQTVVPSSVDVNERNNWCIAQKNTCTTLCSKDWTTNDCDINTLKASCICADGSEPDLVPYRNTLPYFVCTEYIAQCVSKNATMPALQSICRNTNTCGSLDPNDFVPTTTLSTSTGAATTSTAPANGGTNPAASTTDAAPAATSPNAAGTLEPSSVGLLHVVSLFAAFAITGFGMAL